MRSINLSENLITAWLRKFKEKQPLFLVGGSVRDFLLKREFKDYDFLLEGEVFTFVSRLQEKIGGKIVFNKRLLTATLKLKETTLDFASARKEYYGRPGALPLVTPASWQEDLKRRDFTINTMVLPLLEEGWGEVIDPLGGKEDLAHGLIRILHEQSFCDDPTRILRAIRYQNRLGFVMEQKTLQNLKRSWPYLKAVSPRRRLKEWQLLCAEETSEKTIQDIFILGGWPYFMGALSFEQKFWAEQSAFLQKDGFPKGLRPWYLYLLIFLAQEAKKLESISTSWGLYPQEKEGLQQTLALLSAPKQLKGLTWRHLGRRLKELPPEGIYYLFRQNPAWGENWESFYHKILTERMPVKGRDLLALGLEPGPEVGRLLQRLDECYRDNLFNTKKEGLELVSWLLKEEN